jgi:hypothetical protein
LREQERINRNLHRRLALSLELMSDEQIKELHRRVEDDRGDQPGRA